MDRNLGALNVYRDADNRNLYYQWGRKDPFYDKATNPSINNVISATNKGTALNIDESVKNPTIFFLQESGTGNTGTWHGGTAAITTLWDPNTKTVFDPCPAGWQVPEKVAWNFYKWNTNFAWDTANPSGAVLTVKPGVYSWFPIGALKNDLNFDGYKTYMWSSDWENGFPYSYSISWNGGDTSSSATGDVVNNIAGSLGGSVRCVKVK